MDNSPRFSRILLAERIERCFIPDCGACPMKLSMPRGSGGTPQDSSDMSISTTARESNRGSGYRPRRNSIMAALTSEGRSCCVQWPQPGSMTVFRSSGTNRFKLGMS
jgi:hypothetical protein